MLAYQIHLLAHHPDPQTKNSDLEFELKFFLNCILKSPNANMALIWRILEKIKQAQDGQKGDRQTTSLHNFADLAGKLIRVSFKGHRESKFTQSFNLPVNFYEVIKDSHHAKETGDLLHESQYEFTESPIMNYSLKRPRVLENKRDLFNRSVFSQSHEESPQVLSPLNQRTSKRARYLKESQSSKSSVIPQETGFPKQDIVEQTRCTVDSQSSLRTGWSDAQSSRGLHRAGTQSTSIMVEDENISQSRNKNNISLNASLNDDSMDLIELDNISQSSLFSD